MLFRSALLWSFAVTSMALQAAPAMDRQSAPVHAALASPLHVIKNGAFQKVPGAKLRPRRTGESLLSSGSRIFATDINDADKDVESAWAPVRADDGIDSEETIAAMLDAEGSIRLVPVTEGHDYIAKASYHDDTDKVGWGSLSVHIPEGSDVDTASALEDSVDQYTGNVEDGVKMYAAGVVEGYVTAKRIGDFHKVTNALHKQDPENVRQMPTVLKSLKNIADGLAASSEKFNEAASLAGQARLAMLQTWGIRDGYTLASGSSATMPDMFVLNSDGVIDELITAFGNSRDASLAEVAARRDAPQGQLRGKSREAPVTKHLAPKRDHGHILGRCTGLVRLTDDNKELYFAHTTVECYSEMIRIWKVYDFPVKGVAAKKISMSSYPGCISSTDDYYLMDTGLAVMETTLDIPLEQTYPKSQTVPDFIRIMAANRLSTSAKDWVQNMLDSATGTYSSQWMILDYKKFTKGQQLPAGTFYVFEQAPEKSHYEDMSAHVNSNGFWSSYNRAWYDDVRKTTGDDAMMQVLGQKADAEEYSKDKTPRAQIAAATVTGVNSLDDMRKEMTRNKGNLELNLDHDSFKIPLHAISPRNDVIDIAGTHNDRGDPFGGVDGKITSSCLMDKLSAQAISSPSHADLPAFTWLNEDGSEVWPGYPRDGLPNTANFDWINVNPQDQMFTALDNGSCE
jgi:hypothetical protein